LKLGNWDYWKNKWPSWALILLLSGLGYSCAGAEVLTIRQATVQVTTLSLTESLNAQTLPFRWDRNFAGENGRVDYKITLPPRVASEDPQPYAIYVPRVGNQVQVFLNGRMLDGSDKLDLPLQDRSKTPYWKSIPVALLFTDRPNILVFHTSVQALRWGGLSEVYYGLEAELCDRYKVRMWWQHDSYIVLLATLFLMGMVAWSLWIRQREGIYGLFALSAMWGALSNLDQLMSTSMLSWPVQGMLASVALAWHVVFMSRFTLGIVGRNESWVRLALLATSIAIGIAYVLAEPIYWTIAFAMLCFPIVVALICTARVADRDRSKQARLLFVVSLVVAMTALRDFFVVHWPESGMSSYALLPHALFLYVLVMGWILVERYTLQHRQYHELNVTLEDRVAEREHALASSFEIIASQGAEKARLLERQRIMSDIHDGVGGQLVGLVNMIKRGEANQSLFDQKQLSEHAQMTLDELRVAIDAMQPVDGDLSTVLATMRYRLAPRLKASEVELVWRVEELPLLTDLTPQKVLQIQRILLEAFTNILRHSKAHTATLSAQYSEEARAILITLSDDGVGFDADQLEAQGHGLGNMKFRADAIGATIAFERQEPHGVTLTLKLPMI
jgi:signal transduction histidine kinase